MATIVERKGQAVRHNGSYTLNCRAPDCVREVKEGQISIYTHIVDTEQSIDETGRMHYTCVRRWEERAMDQSTSGTKFEPQPCVITWSEPTTRAIAEREAHVHDGFTRRIEGGRRGYTYQWG